MSEVDSKPFNYPILITGGAGFLGSHMVAFCLEKQVDVVVMDNYGSMSLPDLMNAIEPGLKNTQIIVLNGKREELTKVLEKGYQLEKSFVKNQQGIYFLKKGIQWLISFLMY